MNTEVTNAVLETRIRRVICEQLGVKPDEVTLNASFINDLGADSLDTIELVMAFEEEFEVEIPDADAEKIDTMQQVLDYLQTLNIK